MLILTRRPNETIVIGDNNIRITIVSVNGMQVKVGIDAPKDIPVHREEVYLRAKENNTLGGNHEEFNK